MEHLTSAELKLMQIIWENKTGIPSGELVKEADKRLNWKKSTTYTILKKLIEKEMVVNEESHVSFMVSNEQYYNAQKKYAFEKYFSGSLPNFLAAFIREEKVSKKELEQIERIINDYKEEMEDE